MLLLAAWFALAAPVTDWHVDALAPACAAGNGSAAAPFCAVGDALLVAAPGDRVLVAPGTYPERLVVPGGVTVIGTAGAAATVVDGQGLGTTVRTQAGATVVLEGLTITGGSDAAGASGVHVAGSLELRDVVVVQNHGLGVAGGVGLAPTATSLTVLRCRFERNSSLLAGGLSTAAASQVVVEDSTFVENTGGGDGGGIHFWSGALTLRRCSFVRNTAGISGGGVLGGGALVVDGCTFEGNVSAAFGGGLEWLAGSAQLTNSTFSGNENSLGFGGGGGALLQGMTAATARVEHCTFTGNVGLDGGGLQVAPAAGATAGATLANSALVGNVADPGGRGADLFGAIVSGGHNLLGDVAMATLAPTDQLGVPPALAPLRHNGGPTRTHLPLPTSAALDGASPASTLALDQRGAARPAGRADVGAAEVLGRTVGCAVVPNSLGLPAYLVANGDESATVNTLTLVAGDLPTGRFGYFLAGTLVGSLPNPGGSLGVQCVAGAVGRLNRAALGEVRRADARGVIEVTLDLTQLATPTGTEAVLAGDTRVFQLWYRDGLLAPSSNFSEALEVTFR